MCTGNFGGIFKQMAKLNRKMPHSKLREHISANDPGAKALGYEGLGDPLGEAEARFVGEKTKLQRKQIRLRDERAIAARTAERAPQGGHITSIAAMKARRGVQ